MSKLYVSSFEDKGVLRYGIFLDDWKKSMYSSFDTEEEARANLEQTEKEREREKKAVPFSLEDAERYAESHYWKFAITYAKTAPHEYCIKNWLVEEDKLLYERFVATMRANSVVGYFYGHKNDYLILGKHYYWYMGTPENMPVTLINRTTVDYLEFRDGAYYYKPREQKT